MNRLISWFHQEPQVCEMALQGRGSSRWMVDSTGVVCALGYITLAYLARQAGEPSLAAFFAVMAWTAVPVIALYLYFHRRGEPIPIAPLIYWAVVFRLCGLVGGPIYEDDFFRYLWDGYRFATAGSPYGETPEAFFLDESVPLSMQAILSQVNHPELPTIYGPVTQLLFLVAYWIKAGSVVSVQALLISVDLVLVLLLLRLTRSKNVLLYAWCPLVIKEIAFTAHPDGLGVCLVFASIILAHRRQLMWAALFLGLAAGAKIFAIAAAPFVLIRGRLRHWATFLSVFLIVYAPFAVLGATDLVAISAFAREWEFNSAVYGVLTTLLPPTSSKLVLLAACCGIFTWYYVRFRRDDTKTFRGDWIYGILLLVSPVVNPWYLLWLLPFAALFPSVWAWTASAAILLSYITGLNLNDYSMQPYAQPDWVRPLEFGVIGAVALTEYLWSRRMFGSSAEDS